MRFDKGELRLFVEGARDEGNDGNSGIAGECASCEERALAAVNFSRTMLAAAPLGIIAYRAEGPAVVANEAAARILGASVEQLKGQNFREIQSWRETGLLGAAERALATGQEVEIETQFTSTFNKRVCLAFRLKPFMHDGESHLMALFSDISEKKSLEEQLRQAQKMEAIALLAGGVAHDFNNLLTVINGYSDMLIDSPGISVETSEVLKEISRAGERAVKLTRQLLTFSRKQVVHMQELNVNAVVAEVAKMLERLIGENIELTVNLASTLPAIVGDTGMIEQVLMNLCVNARDAMPKGGQLCIGAQAVAVSEKCAQKMDGARAGNFVCLSVADTGCGIRPEDLPRIFEPFFTTKEAGKGTGLGLATVFGIVRQHQGWVAVKSEPERGARFEIFFPIAAPKQAESAGAQDGVVSGRRGAETILLVEDEKALRSLGERVLSKMGYTVLTAGNADEALEIWEKQWKRIDLLFTDMVMPGSMSGRKLAKRLQGQKPGLKVLFSSGYDPESAGQVLSSAEQAIFLQKPYTLPKLMETVRRILDGK